MGWVALVLGSGGREHALAIALCHAPSVSEVVVAPGNAGCARAGHGAASVRCEPIEALSGEAAVALAQRVRADLVVVGPEAPLCAGVVDALGAAGIDAFGPQRDAARLEGSKAFLKRFATRHDIPTAPYLVTSDFDEAATYIRDRGRPVVVKADGLAGGKGAVVTDTATQACEAARSMLVDGALGEAGRTIIIEDRLIGREMSVHAISDGARLLVLPVSRDHKRAGDGDRGPNTGGMGAIAPVDVDASLLDTIEQRILRPTIDGMAAEGCPYRGVLYAGLMIAPDGSPWLLEHNVRFGDPETQVLMELCDGDVAAWLRSAARGKLDPSAATVAAGRHAAVVVLAADGYPSSPRKGDVIEGLDRASGLEGVTLYFAAVRREGDKLLTAGGRVMGASASAGSAAEARARAYRAAEAVHFEGMHYRHDIGGATPDPSDGQPFVPNR